jgi:hypothetical protein
MRTFSSTVQSLINQDTVDFFFLIDLEFDTHHRLSSLPYEVEYPPSSGNTYAANGAILEVDSPKFSSVVDRESYRIVVVEDDDNTFKGEIENNVVGKNITARVGFFDSNGDPVLNVDDTLLVYKGYVDSPAISNNFDNKIVTFEGTSPMADLDMVISFIGSKNGIKQKDSNDESFSNVYGESIIKLKWGKV